ncbi:U4/U6-U5 snRNP complex subunit lsm6 [Entophlyctis sp. JEL0112]|nr:U4/U6-U5 snRNP complex subunit lsm6 [Entophlyctis sp. JEL0112]
MEKANARSPGDFLAAAIGARVVVRLNSGVEYRGVLACLDGYMNIAMEQTEEFVAGDLKNRYGDAFIRGNNGIQLPLFVRPRAKHSSFSVLYISAAPAHA